jgi:CheY-like chemotaxis protein
MATTRRDSRKPLLVCVDDDPEILRSLRRVFRSEPWEVLTTEHPAEVLQWICDRKVDLIIADQRMPDMNGSDLLEVAAASAKSEVVVECGGATARDVIARILPACSQARAEGTTAVIVLRNLSSLNDSLSRLLKGLARAVAWSHTPIDLRDDSGCVAAFVAALSRSTSVR